MYFFKCVYIYEAAKAPSVLPISAMIEVYKDKGGSCQ